ncbi:MAG: hypothetical protein AB1758_07880 [Candidatus Eremiobacterota bacterium]
MLCQMGDDGNLYFQNAMPGRAQREYLRILCYLAGRGLIDQFLLGKAYLGLMATAAVAQMEALRALVDKPATGGWSGPMEVVGVFFNPAHHCFKSPMLSQEDNQLYQELCAFARGRGPQPTRPMSPWDLRLATQDRFPVLLVTRSIVATVLEKASPPVLSPELEGLELDIRVPGLD